MADILSQYGTAGQAITITLTSLGGGSAQQSSAVDNTSNRFLDALVTIKVKTGASGTSTTGRLDVYAYATVDNGSTYTHPATGTNGSITVTYPSNLRLIGAINVAANGTEYVAGPFSIASAFGGVLPAKWGIAVYNLSGATLDASVGEALYQGVYGQN